ncbi:uncharacterized protein M421DRAFT_96645 [Didymella exigua CBS 183.55]|uniref:Uncharacterized protein n=1 Tax=Didymella exigua CBS 183.55 TaxID=1150837 RepID=A0A6A5R3K8_9PLEO|nr:uncharacterized protein M421DRAFT_96645 [Didymella exigua CBS 183.55]KAF1922651.1 hypothetical protein M421DRAFT_96645 [Didymella exigua CBS 183.55]
MPSKRKQSLHKQAIIETDAFREAQKKGAEQKEAMKATESITLPSVPDASNPRNSSVHKSQPRKVVVPNALLQVVNPNVRKLPDAACEKGVVIIDGNSFQKSLARKKKAHRVPLRDTATKAEKKLAPVDATQVPESHFTSTSEQTVDDGTFEALHSIIKLPSGDLDLHELVSPQSLTSSELRLQSLDRFSGDFAFAEPQYTPLSKLDWKMPGLFNMPPSAGPIVKPIPILSSTTDSTSTFAFEAPRIAPEPASLAPVVSDVPPGPEERTRFDLAMAFWTSVSHTKTLGGEESVFTGAGTEIFENDAEDGNEASIDSAVVRSVDVEELQTNYPNVYATALDRSTDALTLKLVAFGQATGITASNADSQRSCTAAVAILDGLHISIQDIDLVAELEITCKDAIGDGEEETETAEDETVGTPLSEHGQVSSVSTSEPLYYGEARDEQDSDFEFAASPVKDQVLLLEGSDDTTAVCPEDPDSNKEADSSQQAGPVVHVRDVADTSPLVASVKANDHPPPLRTSQQWLTLTAPPTTTPQSGIKRSAVTPGRQEWLTLTPSFVELPLEMTDHSSYVGQSPSLGRDTADKVTKPETPEIISFESASSNESSAEGASTADGEPTAPGASPDWTAELVCAMLGTESLFDFMSILGVSEDGSTSKSALVTAFLILVRAERRKLDLPAPPPSCTATSVLTSKILPYTTVLGTT